MLEVAATAVKLFSSDWNPQYESMPIGQDQVSTILSPVSNTIDPQSFYDELETQTAISKMKMSIGATSIIPPDEEDILEGVDVVVTPEGSELAPYDASYAEN